LPDYWWKFTFLAVTYVYNCRSIIHLKWKNSHEIFLSKMSKTSHFHIFGCNTYIFLSNKVHTNKLASHTELMIFIRYENNGYCFMHHIQENVISHFTHIIFNEEFFSKCINSYTKEYKLYEKLFDKKVQRQCC